MGIVVDVMILFRVVAFLGFNFMDVEFEFVVVSDMELLGDLLWVIVFCNNGGSLGSLI